ncbi:MAG: GNAT family N-acetyltransferase [Bacteroidales bacterium]|nr:GNAT family N-acetyltransferase [Bacteroidales bacterium]
MIEKLFWDSNFFGYPVGKLELKQTTDFDLMSFKENAQKYQLVYIFSEEELKCDDPSLTLNDIKVTFLKKLCEELSDSIPECTPYIFNSADYSELESLALESGKYSRFKTDQNFKNNEFEKLYKKWIFESVKKNITQEVLVYRKEKQIAGFVSIVKNYNYIAQIGLIAVLKDFQGYGVGGILMKNAERFAFMHKYAKMQVVTQLNNIQAVSFYKKHSYSIQKKTFIYHFWKH